MDNRTGERLKYVRTLKKIKQIDAAEALGVSHGLLSHYENGVRQPGLDFLRAASAYYGVTTDYLLALTDVNVHLPAGAVSDAAKAGFEQIVDVVTGIYALLAIVDDADLSESTTAFVGASLYRIFRPMFDIHGVRYDAHFRVTSDTFSLCSAAVLLSETSLLMKLRALPEETVRRLAALSLEAELPVNVRTFLQSLERIDAKISSCNPEPRFLDSYQP